MHAAFRFLESKAAYRLHAIAGSPDHWRTMMRTLLVPVLFALGLLACQSTKNGETPPSEQASAQPVVTPSSVETTPAAPAPADAAPGAGEPRVFTGIVARVNGVDIPAEAFNAEVSKVAKAGAALPADRLSRIEWDALSRMIDDLLVAQAVKAEGVVVSDAEFAAEFAKYKERFKTEEQYQNFLKYGKTSEEQIKDTVRQKAALTALLRKKADLAVSDEDVRAFYEKNQRFYTERPSAVIKQILVRVPKTADEAQTRTADEKVKVIQAALSTKPFEDVAREHSEDASAKKGGEMEPIVQGRYVKEVEDAAFALKPGEVSTPIRTQLGYHVVKLVEKRPERMKAFEEVKNQIAETLANRNFYSEKRKLTDELKKTATIERLADIKEPQAPARAATQPATPPTGAVTAAPSAGQ